MKSKTKHDLSVKNLHVEIIIFFILFAIILINALVFSDNMISVLYAVCGILYTMLAGKGRTICYLFGITATLCYSYLSYTNSLYGNMGLNLCYYLPMQIYGIFAWNKNLDKTTNEIIKTKLDTKNRIRFTIIAIILSVLAITLLSYFNDKHPIIDGTITVLSILAMVLTVKRCIEQWILWTIVNLLSIILWIQISLSGVKTYSTIIVWCVYLVLGIYFYKKWREIY